ncbi:MAG: hypothetical protein HUJ54_00690 [Erysipelotrichaceae bacterium]|nr:hypothetical protein [Erysipelotrichaceae bacterium]
MSKNHIGPFEENGQYPVQAVPEILHAKRRSYQWIAAGLLAAAATAFAAKVLLTSPSLYEYAAMLPVLRNTVLLLLMTMSLIISVIYKYGNPIAVRIFMMSDFAAAGLLAAVLGLHTSMAWFGLYVIIAVVLAGVFLYVQYKFKYDPKEAGSAVLTGPHHGLYAFAEGQKAGADKAEAKK